MAATFAKSMLIFLYANMVKSVAQMWTELTKKGKKKKKDFIQCSSVLIV